MRFLFTSTAVWLIMASLVALGEPAWNMVATAQAQAQRISQLPNVHYLQDADSEPGVVGQRRLLSRAQVAGYFQPSKSPVQKSWKSHSLNQVNSRTTFSAGESRHAGRFGVSLACNQHTTASR